MAAGLKAFIGAVVVTGALFMAFVNLVRNLPIRFAFTGCGLLVVTWILAEILLKRGALSRSFFDNVPGQLAGTRGTVAGILSVLSSPLWWPYLEQTPVGKLDDSVAPAESKPSSPPAPGLEVRALAPALVSERCAIDLVVANARGSRVLLTGLKVEFAFGNPDLSMLGAIVERTTYDLQKVFVDITTHVVTGSVNSSNLTLPVTGTFRKSALGPWRLTMRFDLRDEVDSNRALDVQVVLPKDFVVVKQTEAPSAGLGLHRSPQTSLDILPTCELLARHERILSTVTVLHGQGEMVTEKRTVSFAALVAP